MQTNFASDGYDKLGSVQRYFAEGIREDYAAGNLDAQVSSLVLSLIFLTDLDNLLIRLKDVFRS